MLSGLNEKREDDVAKSYFNNLHSLHTCWIVIYIFFNKIVTVWLFLEETEWSL